MNCCLESKMKRLILALVAVVLLGSCKERAQARAPSPSADVYVRADGGLRMRAEPRTDSPVIFNIPDGEKLDLLADASEEITIDGKKGRFRKVSHRNKTGWVFDVFFSPDPPPVPGVCKAFVAEKSTGACTGLNLKERVLTAGKRKFRIQKIVRYNRQGCTLDAEEEGRQGAAFEIILKPVKGGYTVRIAQNGGEKSLECPLRMPAEGKP